MDDDPFSLLGLRPVELADRTLIDSYLRSLAEPISDYTFSQLFTWRNSLRIGWKLIDGHLCVFANGSGDLTLLLPPIGEGRSDRALAESFELMDAYNIDHGVPERTRVEYASAELLGRLDCAGLDVRPMGADYVYDVNRMIDLAGGDLASKRQAKNRFMRNYAYRVEEYRAADHMPGCLALLDEWKVHQDANHLEEPNAASIKRDKESIATRLCLESSQILGMQGMVVLVRDTAAEGAGGGDWSLRGFTFGEPLGHNQSSITIEKTDLSTKGLAQFIFSEFCRLNWSR
ncbi:MAG TPA: phosphatidylglycerol lysyltransferase domain-containing protein, partial [Tepidisphaeraceae bacterium]|nr:phosphatidylglycerol lysyltransferase domain-containing protein [Tepidisphaeraceae bacterium]